MKSAIRVVGFLFVLAALGSTASAQAVQGTGTVGQLPLWVAIDTIADSVITQNSDGSLSINVTSSGTAVFVHNSATSGSTNGLFGNVDSPDGNGVLGNNNATSGFAVGVTGITYSPAGAGLNGFSLSTSGGIGVIGSSPASGWGHRTKSSMQRAGFLYQGGRDCGPICHWRGRNPSQRPGRHP